MRNIIEICLDLKVPEQFWIWDKEESSFLMIAGVEVVTRDGKYIDIYEKMWSLKENTALLLQKDQPSSEFVILLD